MVTSLGDVYFTRSSKNQEVRNMSKITIALPTNIIVRFIELLTVNNISEFESIIN